MPRVAVVLSAYNGEEFLPAQIDSLLAQDYPNVDVFARDDGSPHEACRRVLRSYEQRGLVSLDCGRNMGPTASFIELVSGLPDEYDYVALCDQDDVWHPDKIPRAVEVLSRCDDSIPQLYCAEYEFCDAQMNPTGRSHLNKIGVDFSKMLYENVVSGNTVVINRRLVQLVGEAGPRGVYTHDWWLALVASALGELHYDDFVCLDYRRTGSNASATGSGAAKVLQNRVRRYLAGDELSRVTAQLRRLYELWGDQMPGERRELLRLAIDGGRWRKATLPMRLRQTVGGEVAVRLLFLLGRL